MSPVLETRRPLESPHTPHAKRSHSPRTDETTLRQHDGVPYLTAFPIRTTQPETNSTLQHQQLRRKTPSGIVDAGYDGSSRRDIEEPPSKQLVLSATHTALQGATIEPYYIPTTDTIWPAQSPPLNPAAAQNQIPWISPFTPNTPHYFQGPFQPAIRSNDYNTGAYCPISPEVAFEQTHAHLSYLHENVAAPYNRSQLSQGPEYYQHISMHSPCFSNPLQESSATKAPELQLDAVGYETPSSGLDYGQPPDSQGHFKERALIQAYNRYMGLVAYIQSTTRHTTGNERIKTQFRHMIFPKPPKPYSPNSTLSKIVALPLSPPTNSVNFNHHGQQDLPQPPLQLSTPQHSWGTSQSNLAALEQPRLRESDQIRMHQPGYSHPLPENIGMRHNDDALVLASDLRCSLEVIKTMCEQASWTWVDGMLLLGCMYHALEQFESALLWFARIINFNSRFGTDFSLARALLTSPFFQPR